MTKPTGNPMGRPPFDLTDEKFNMVVGMMKIQCTKEEIAGVLDIDEDTLNAALKRRGEPTFSALYKKHQNEGKASLRRNQWKAAEAGNPTMLIWLGKQVLGQKDRQDFSSEDGSMTPATALPVHEMSLATLRELQGLGIVDDDPTDT